MHNLSTAKNIGAKPYVIGAQRKAIEENLKTNGLDNFKLNQDEQYYGQWQLSFKQEKMPKVSIIINDSIKKNVMSNIKANTNYKNYEMHTYRSDKVCKNIISMVDGEFLVFITKKINIGNKNWISDLLGDAIRFDIGFVLAELGSSNDVMKLIEKLVDKDAVSLIKKVSNRNTAKHLYYTSRYDVKSIYDGLAMVETSKLRKFFSDSQDNEINLSELSQLADNYGYRNLYNPYITMKK